MKDFEKLITSRNPRLRLREGNVFCKGNINLIFN